MQCTHHSPARRNCSCMMFCCAEMRLLRNEVCAMRKMMCADAHSFMPRRAYHFRHSRNIIAQHIICRRQASLRIQCAHHSAARQNCSCMMFCCAEMRLLRNEVCAMRKMMCADAHSFMPRRAYHFRHSRNIIAQHIICRRQTSLRMQCAHHSAARRKKGAMALASPWRTME